MSNEDLRAYLESIDRKLETLAGKLDDLQGSVMTRAECAACSEKYMPKRYIGGFAGFFVVIGILAAFAGDIWGFAQWMGKIAR